MHEHAHDHRNGSHIFVRSIFVHDWPVETHCAGSQEATDEMNERVLVLISIAIAATGLVLLQTYKEYAKFSESLMTLLGLIASVLSIWQFLRRD